jgi:hypothetical protein
MLCELCYQKVKTKRHIYNLFDPEIHHLCEACYQKYPLFPKVSVYPIEHYELRHYLMSSIPYNQNPSAYMSMLQTYYVIFLKHYSSHIFLYFDILEDNHLSLMDSLKLGNLFIVSLYENIEEKGE